MLIKKMEQEGIKEIIEIDPEEEYKLLESEFKLNN